MSIIFNIRHLTLPHLTRGVAIACASVLIVGFCAALAAWHLYNKLTTKTATAEFTQTLALYPGDEVQIMGVKVGAVDKVQPDGDKMKVELHYDSKYRLPANVTASILNPSLVASRTVELGPPYTSGPTLRDGATIPLDRTQVPVEYDQLRDSITRVLKDLGPSPQQPQGPFGQAIESFSDELAGKGQEINTTLDRLSEALVTLNQSRGDTTGVITSLAKFVNALYKSDHQFRALNNNLAQFTDAFTQTDHDVTAALQSLHQLLGATRGFLDGNSAVLTTDIDDLANVTNAVLQPGPREGLETTLHVFPNLGANILNIYSPSHGSLVAIPTLNNFANPMQLVCSAIQAGSRLGYQDSAELCAQYLAPILDAIKFNYPPFGVTPIRTAEVLPKQVAYSEPRLAPPPGYKDTTVPGIFSRDTLFSYGNHEPGWVAAPGMQGVAVQPGTAAMLTPDSLAELLGGSDAAIPPAPPALGVPPGGHLPGAPNDFDEANPPPPGSPQPVPVPLPGPPARAGGD